MKWSLRLGALTNKEILPFEAIQSAIDIKRFYAIELGLDAPISPRLVGGPFFSIEDGENTVFEAPMPEPLLISQLRRMGQEAGGAVECGAK